jgi:predicted N-formylglutamate amidohydrolase
MDKLARINAQANAVFTLTDFTCLFHGKLRPFQLVLLFHGPDRPSNLLKNVNRATPTFV